MDIDIYEREREIRLELHKIRSQRDGASGPIYTG